MKFEDIKTLYCSNNVVTINGETIEIDTRLEDSTTIQFLSGRNFIIEEPSMKKVSTSKYQYILDEFQKKKESELQDIKIVENNVPNSITMRQARLWLYKNDRLDLVEDYVKTNKEVEIEWEYSTELYRNNNLVLLVCEYLGISEEEIDSIFIEASVL